MVQNRFYLRFSKENYFNFLIFYNSSFSLNKSNFLHKPNRKKMQNRHLHFFASQNIIVFIMRFFCYYFYDTKTKVCIFKMHLSSK